MRRADCLLALVLLAGCRDARTPAPATSAPAPAAAAPAGIDPRDQYALVRAIAAAPADDDERLDEVSRGWRDRRYRWEVYFLPALCKRPDSCFVVPFDHTLAGTAILEGWLPRLALDAGQRAAIDRACAGLARCVLRFEGRLADLTLSSVLPTALTFDQVRVLGARAAGGGEEWFTRWRSRSAGSTKRS